MSVQLGPEYAIAQRRGKNIGAVAVANKNARIVWAVLSNKTTYQAQANAA